MSGRRSAGDLVHPSASQDIRLLVPMPVGGTAGRREVCAARLPIHLWRTSFASMARAHLLVVDDEPSILTTLQKALSLEGYSVDVAGGVRVAEERLGKRSYDIMLLDVSLPDGDGVSLLQQLRAGG